MKKMFLFFLILLGLVSCGNSSSNELDSSSGTDEPVVLEGEGIVVYFSATNNTKRVSNIITEHLQISTFELQPIEPYSSADLNYSSPSSRVSLEHNDPNRHVPLTSTAIDNFDALEYIFIGYPIWWGEASWVLDDFVKNNDFTGKTIIPFGTFASSPLGNSAKNLAAKAGNGTWQEGMRFSSTASEQTILTWLEQLNLEEEQKQMNLYIQGKQLKVELTQNSSVTALVELLKKGDITYTATDYGDFEKMGNIGYSLPQNNTPIDTVPGDVILYQGTSLCLYYGNNSWSFTRIGRITGYTEAELRTLLGAGTGSIEVRISLH